MNNNIVIAFCVFLTFMFSSVHANDFVPAKFLNSPIPRYWYIYWETKRVDSGVVELVFTVDKTGVPFDIEVVRSSMSMLESHAVSAVSKYTYQAATLNTKPVKSRQIARIEFDHSKHTSVGFVATPMQAPEGYMSLYNTFKKELEKEQPSKRKASHTLKKMRMLAVQSFVSGIHNELAQHRLETLFGTKEQQLEPLLKILMYEDVEWAGKHALDVDTKLTIQQSVLKLMLELGKNAEALEKYNEYSKNNPPIIEAFSSYIEKIKEIQKNDNVVERKVTIAQRGYTFLPLLKRSFIIEALEGQLDSFKLRCDTKFAKINFKADAQYQLPDSWGSCELQLIGTPDSLVSVLQQ